MPLAAACCLDCARITDDFRIRPEPHQSGSGTSGIFDVRLNGETIFSRKTEQRFPESKELKQLIRDRIDPERPLGHSDNPK
jgi:selT/selW/selH-like putative selenoprotein